MTTPEPPCKQGHNHAWYAPKSVVGGDGIGGNGEHVVEGRIVSLRVCIRCGRYMESSGMWPGHEDYVDYREPDDKSLAWLRLNEPRQ